MDESIDNTNPEYVLNSAKRVLEVIKIEEQLSKKGTVYKINKKLVSELRKEQCSDIRRMYR